MGGSRIGIRNKSRGEAERNLNDEATKREVEERFNTVKRLYGDRLDKKQLEGVRTGVEAIVRASQAVSAVRLENGDEPFSVFSPYREED